MNTIALGRIGSTCFWGSLYFDIYFSLSTSSQLTFQWVVHVIDGMDYRGQTREELSWTCLWQKVWRLKPFSPLPTFFHRTLSLPRSVGYATIVCPQLGGANSTMLCGQTREELHILDVSLTKSLAAQAFFPPFSTFFHCTLSLPRWDTNIYNFGHTMLLLLDILVKYGHWLAAPLALTSVIKRGHQLKLDTKAFFFFSLFFLLLNSPFTYKTEI